MRWKFGFDPDGGNGKYTLDVTPDFEAGLGELLVLYAMFTSRMLYTAGSQSFTSYLVLNYLSYIQKFQDHATSAWEESPNFILSEPEPLDISRVVRPLTGPDRPTIRFNKKSKNDSPTLEAMTAANITGFDWLTVHRTILKDILEFTDPEFPLPAFKNLNYVLLMRALSAIAVAYSDDMDLYKKATSVNLVPLLVAEELIQRETAT